MMVKQTVNNCSILFVVGFACLLALVYQPPVCHSHFGKPGHVVRARREVRDSCHLRELELCAMGFMSLFQNQNGLPLTKTELNRQCEYFSESIECFNNYNQRCLTRRTAGLAEIFMRSGVKMAQDFCKEDSELRRNYTKHVDCFRSVQRDHQRHCLTDFQVGFEGIHKLEHPKRLPLSCCNLGRLKECIFVPIDNECGVSASLTVESLLESIFGGIYLFPCRAYNSTNPTCLELLPEINRKPHVGRNVSALSKIVSSFTNVPAQL